MSSAEPKAFRKRRLLHVLCIFYAIAWCVAAIHPVDRSDWLLENVMVFAFLLLLGFTYRRLPLSDTSYVLIFLFMCMHVVGAHYAYRPPAGEWIKYTGQFSRNHYDRIVHFAFGLLMTFPLREVLVRAAQVRVGIWAAVLSVALIVSLSGIFEIIEMMVVLVVSPELGSAYLGAQGDEWDAQKDMGLAGIGAILAMTVLRLVSRRNRT